MLLGNATAKQLEAMNRLRSSEMAGVRELLAHYLDDTIAALVRADDQVTVYRLQGRAAVLEDFIESIDQAPETLSRRQNRSGRPSR